MPDMPRRFSALWIPLLAALLAGPLVQRWPDWTSSTSVGQVVVSGPPAKAVLPSSRLQLVLPHFLSTVDRQGASSGPALPAENQALVLSQEITASPANRLGGPLAESARHFPLFPTGPPSNG